MAHGQPNSWADGTHTVFGQDAIDFDITLALVDKATNTATLVIKHVPPSALKLKMPIVWMEKPVSDSPNNWAQVQKQPDGSYIVEVGKETFESTIRVSLDDGRILDGSLINPVQFIRRHCDDAALAHCGEASTDQIMRRVQLISEK